MKNTLLILSLVIAIVSCGPKQKKQEESVGSETTNIENIKEAFIDDLWKNYPVWASYVGFHDYDDQLPIPDQSRRDAQLEFSKNWLDSLSSIDMDALSENDRIDVLIMQDFLKGIEFDINDYQSFKWNPSSYNLGGGFFQVLNYRKESLDDRLMTIYEKLAHVPAFYEAAKANIDRPTKVHTDLAISQLKGSISVFQNSLNDSLDESGLDAQKIASIKSRRDTAVAAIQSFVDYLEKELVPNFSEENTRSFRIGKELFEQKFYYDIQSAYSAEEIFEIAVAEKTELHDKMYKVSDALWEKYFGEQEKPGKRLDLIRMVIEEVSKTHVHRDSFITAIRQQIPELEAFIKENDLIDLDPEKPLVVRETPKYMQGVAGASISAPGPYDKDAETYYNVTPLDHYTEEEAESYLREYNQYLLQILNIHEAIPGHYTQLVYSNESPSLIKSILGNGAMIEGWAVYTELMMLEAGYGGDQMEMGLMYYKWNLRTVCNTILDYGVHVNNFTEEDAMQLLVKEAFQEEAEAKGKWKRARLSQVQLCSYFTGFHEIRELRDSVMNQRGEDYSLKDFHHEFLSYGSAPVKYIARMMLMDEQENEGITENSSL
ncbi:MAG: DUF885 domain-containing protein [Flavobacteriales bacterium]|nr:DUF885 domain-containing protein [Flavobacteriales bacterium]